MSVSNIHNAKTNLSKLIAAAERGEEVIIARAGKPIVRLVACGGDGESRRKTFSRGFGMWKSEFTMPDWDEWKRGDEEIATQFSASINQPWD